MKLLIGILVFIGNSVYCKDHEFYCQACYALVDESYHTVLSVDKAKRIEVGAGRVDPNGKMKQKKRDFRTSESHLTEVFEKVCKGIADDWVIEQNPDTGAKRIKRMMSFDGKMNTDVNFQWIMQEKEQDPGKPPSKDPLKIRWTCENVLEEIEEDLLEAFQTLGDDETALTLPEMKKVCNFVCPKRKDEL